MSVSCSYCTWGRAGCHQPLLGVSQTLRKLYWCLQTRSESERLTKGAVGVHPFARYSSLFPPVSYSLWKECTNGLDDVTPVGGSFCTHPSGLQRRHYLPTFRETMQIKGRQGGRKMGRGEGGSIPHAEKERWRQDEERQEICHGVSRATAASC